ncbi:phosphonoacetaldehyde phosphonohydrolase-related protein [Pseudomonas sp. dw_358]|uniref:phosphonoacetaldehyde phosphonohydrolase-related protein n=1 Tax=Pseudomonas sp. dw_358 TaxID=2720083 RepID=UPI001BD276F1|nr:phosphonoacetaldehyde phosphonohydrolase-related protein [Pseudomonas sp. dw_358]
MPETAAFPPLTAILLGLGDCLVDDADRLMPGAAQLLERLHGEKVPCAWIDELESETARRRSAALPDWVTGCNRLPGEAPWPSPASCWRALITLGATRLDGCLLVSGEPRLLQAALAAGLWTVGLASCGARAGLANVEWLALTPHARDLKRGKVTLELFKLGVHSVIDHLEELDSCLEDIGSRRAKGEKP